MNVFDRNFFYLIAGGIIFLGLWPDFSFHLVKLAINYSGGVNIFVVVFLAVFLALILLPLLLAILSIVLKRKPGLEPCALASFLAKVLTIIALPLVFFWSSLAGPSFLHQFLYAGAVILGASGALKLYGQGAASKGLLPVRSGVAGLVFALLVALWSLGVAVFVPYSAKVLAGERPYCIGFHGEDRAVHSLWQLRGVSFYTTKTGYKSSSRWYFHGVLIAGNKYYNWSYRYMRFRPLPREQMLLVRVMGTCQPVKNFINSLLFSDSS